MKFILLIILLLFININNAYKPREIVRVNLQTKTGANIEHHDLSPRIAPKFKVDLSKSLLNLDSSNNKKAELLPNILYKILFSFDNDRFKTTWITVSDGNGKFLNHIDFTFIYSNDKIIDLKYNLDYNDEAVHHGKKQSDFYINYRWEEIRDKDLSSGLFVLFTVGLIVSGISFTHITISFASKPSKIKNLPSYYQKAKTESENINNYNNSSNYRQQHQHHQHQHQQNYNNQSNYEQNQQKFNQEEQQHNNENIQPLSSYDTSPSYHLSPPPIANNDDTNNNIDNNNNEENTKNDFDVSDSEIESFVELNRNK
ncbi:hypothetical protein DICPUDRAFT_80560 [Dictyostelium purpureum]|uniref:Signal sequence receptor subunit alpha n=1 Tax=Dictyostelium purpureum TaxID=5786 RepID=F0ZQV1_DICPU|nr:uncharacterized protein DICPUDRAFT_80560 [Dictyostelium purpureum]EGC33673.1 hypothetical protein DICPUDRAFT_80560 [Dictyostelium purpureum]|eukprot:XP_003289792.1 hypothetical protein DICPUDRAFT_80560 [Dictyostelium purpureum]